MNSLVREIIDAYNPEHTISRASTPPFSWYTDAQFFELERRAVFARSWQVVARSDQFRESGHYVTCEVGAEPIFLIKGEDGVLRGFFNVCRHHAAVVLTNPEGKADVLRCPYHGWTYNLEGDLLLAPEFGGVADFDRAANGLIRVDVGLWNRWVFTRLADGALSLVEFLCKNLIEAFEQLSLERFVWFERRTYPLNCNWKVFVDNYLDGGYHVPHIHRGLNSVLDYGYYTIETGERSCLQWSPIIPGSAENKTAEVRQGERALFYWIYPNFMINIYAGVMDTNLIIPRTVDKTDVIFDYYFVDTSEQAREHNLASIAVSEQIQAEDAAICQSVQRGLLSRSYSSGRLSVQREAGEHLFHRLLHADLKAGIAELS